MPSSGPGGTSFVPNARRLKAVGLRRCGPDDLVIRRRRCGRGFLYLDPSGARIRDQSILARIRALAIPPNYGDVCIAADPDLHLQAIGQDEAGRTQYRYHPKWEAVRERQKFDRLSAIAGVIGRVRRRIARDLRRPVGSREHALATLVLLIDRTHIRIGGENYVHTGRSRGAATLLVRNVEVAGDEVRLTFRAKGGRAFACSVRAPALARAVEALRSLPGRRLFQYRDAQGRLRRVTAGDANAYLREITGLSVTAKDFRMLGANADAAVRLAAIEPAPTPTARRRQTAAVIREVSTLLGNTPAVVRKSYVHAELLAVFERGKLAALNAAIRPAGGRTRGEQLVAALFVEPTAGKRARG